MSHAIFDQIIRPGSVVFDVGANHGNKTQMFVERGAIVVAFEPQPQCVASLRQRFDGNPQVVIEPVGLSFQTGHAIMRLGEADTLSTISTAFIQATQLARFQGHRWHRNLTIPLDTLDRMIDKYGQPDFVKIDVEGYESAVLAGLSHPVSTVSIEFTPELKDKTRLCLERLLRITPTYLFNYSEGETGRFHFPRFVPIDDMWEFLHAKNDFVISFGDVYAQC